MVKKLIKGLFTKKEGNSKADEQKKSEEIPDELPPLAEDLMEKDSAKKEEKPTEEPKEEEIGIGELTEEKEDVKEPGPPEELEAPVPKKEEPKEALKEAIKDKKETKKPTFEQPIEEEKGFFSDLFTIVKRQGINEEILKQDLYKRMKNYWYYHPKGARFKNKYKLEEEIFSELSQLKKLEERWTAQKNFLEEDRRILLEKERELVTKTEKLQRILNQLKFYKDASPDNYFRLKNGTIAKNVHELMSILEVIDNATFHFHVNRNKNDFSSWVRKAIGDEELAKKLDNAKTREEVLVILENASIGDIDTLNPENYFRMSDGRVLKDLKELLNALKETDNITFKHHVSKDKNDFSNWAKHVFKNEYLAQKLKEVASKEGTIKVLEEYL